MTLTLGLFGCGGMSRRHLLGMKKLRDSGHMRFELAGVCDLLPENAAAPQAWPMICGLRSLALVYGFFESERLGRTVQIDELLSGEVVTYQDEIEG